VCWEHFNKRSAVVLTYLVILLVLPHLSDLSLKIGEEFCWGLFCMHVGFHCPIYALFESYNGAAFPSGELHSFMGFLSGLTEMVGVTRFTIVTKMEIRPEFVMFLLSENVAHSSSSYYVVIVMIMIVLYIVGIGYCY
jgi:hypothetical protein